MKLRCRIRRALSVAICAAGFLAPSAASKPAIANELQPFRQRLTVKMEGFMIARPQVAGGAEQKAKNYYANIVTPQMNFPGAADGKTIKDLLVYYGHSAISPKDLHALTSDQLMALGAGDEILATRFFAPKITDVQDKHVQIPEGGFGWRKLVRLKAKPNSDAAANGMDAVYILQNITEQTATGDPFDIDKNVSRFNQAIAIRKKPSGGFTAQQRPAYFLAYGRLVKVKVLADNSVVPDKANGEFQDDGILAFSLAATFDENDRNPETNSKPKDYFVPDACEHCHGGLATPTRGKLNYLDTDHWFDRVTPAYGLSDPKFKEEDFIALQASPHGVLYDGGKDMTTNQFKKAFDVIRLINEEIFQQNEGVGGIDNFQLASVDKWLKLHKTDYSHVPPPERGFGANPWNSQSESDKTLLYYLNRYCYRCHSSVKYNVFERSKVVAKKGDIASRVMLLDDPLEPDNPLNWMPQDRIFPGLGQTNGNATATGDLEEFLKLLQQLQ